MIKIDNIKDIAYDFKNKLIIVTLIKPVLIKEFRRTRISKNGTYEDFCKYSKKIDNFKL